MKVDASGNLQWQKSYGGSDADNGKSVLVTNDGGYLVLANTRSVDGHVTGPLGDTDIWLLKLSSDGTLEWDRSYGGSGIDVGFDLTSTNDGYLIIGETHSTDGMVSQNLGFGDIWLIKVDLMGTLIWERSYGGASGDFGTSIDQMANGDLAICGYLGDTGGGLYSVFAALVDQNGNTIWEDVFGGSGLDGPSKVKVSPTDEIHIVGVTHSSDGDIVENKGISDLWLLKLDGDGEILLSKTLGGADRDAGTDLQFTSDGGILISGGSMSADGDLTMNYGSFDAWILRLDELGEILWQRTYGGTDSDSGQRLMILDDGKIVFGGNTRSNNIDVSGHHGDLDYWFVMLESDPVGIVEQRSWIQAAIHPNPTKDMITVTLNGERNQQVSIDLVDAAGRLTPVRGTYRVTAGEDRLVIDLSQQAPGIYHLVIHGTGTPVRLPVVKL